MLRGKPVYLDRAQRIIAGQAFVEKLVELDTELLVFSLDACHYHALARFPDQEVRMRVGRAKKNSSHLLRSSGLAGTVWAKKCRALPVSDRRHQLNVFSYIENHRLQDAWVWIFREGLYWLKRENRKTQ